MGSTSQTPNIGLSQFADDDRPTWRGDYNGDMDKIDNGHGELLGQINQLQSTVTKIQTNNVVNVANYGNTPDLVQAALNAAEARGIGSVLYFPAGRYDVGSGLNLSGKSVQIRGDGAHGDANNQYGTVLYASSQSGAVLDYTGYVAPQPGMGAKTIHGGFWLVGSGVADTTLNNAGLKLKTMSSAYFHDIAVISTGGPCVDLKDGNGSSVYCCDFERITCNTPISANANNVPYFRAVECNGNRFIGIGFRSTLATHDTGVSGVVNINGGTTYADNNNYFGEWWFENIHVPSGGTIVNVAGVNNVFDGFQFFDVAKESGGSGTSYVRLSKPTASVTGDGGNSWRGVVPGHDSASSLSIDMGIDMQQSYNYVHGIKGYKGTNVVLSAGVQYNRINLFGSNGATSDTGVIDNSGVKTNSWTDSYNNINHGINAWEQDSSVTYAGPRFYDPATSNGYILIGKSGVMDSAIGTTKTTYADNLTFRSVATASVGTTISVGNNGPTISAGSVAPNNNVVAPPGSIYMQTTGGASTSLWVKETRYDNQGWVGK